MTAALAVQERAPTRREWPGLAVLSIGLGLIVLDGRIVGVAPPAIIGDLHLRQASPSTPINPSAEEAQRP